MSKTNDNNQPVVVERKQPQAASPTNEVFIRVGTTLYKVVDQPTINGGKVRKRIPWNMETLRQDYGKEFIKYVHKYDGFCTVPEHVNHRTVIDGFLNLYQGRRIKLRCPPKVLTGTLHPSLPSIFSG